MVKDDIGERFCIVRMEKKGTPSILFTGTTLPWYLPWCMPLAVRTDSGVSPCSVTSEDLNDRDPDTWIEQNEERIIPAGFNSEELVTEYSVNDGKITAVTINKKHLKKYLESCTSNLKIESLKPPLWELCSLYAQQIDSPFIVWKLTETGSVFAYCNDKKVSKLLTSWISLKDFNEADGPVIEEINCYIKQFANENNPIPVYVMSSLRNDELPSSLVLKNGRISRLPELSSIPSANHELYSLAISTDERLNFVSHDALQKIKKETLFWSYSMNTIKMVLILVAWVSALIVSTIGLQYVLQQSMSDSLIKIENTRNILKQEKKRFDSLSTGLTEKIKFLHKESTVTTLLNSLQDVFPEGMWAEEIAIAENKPLQWMLQIRALSESSSLLTTFTGRLRTIQGVKNVRVVYSETTKSKNQSKSLFRVKIECDWQ